MNHSIAAVVNASSTPAVPLSEYHRSIDTLDAAIVSLTRTLTSNEYRLLVLVREFDERGGWLKWGLSNCAEWLHYRCDLSLSAAREKLRVAHALKELPEISAAFEKGVLTYSKVRALTRVANVANESALLEFALRTTASRVEERCRQMRNAELASCADANRAHERRRLSLWRDETRGTLQISVELPLEQGELIAKALEKAAESAANEDAESAKESWQAQQADALVEIARAYLCGGTGDGAFVEGSTGTHATSPAADHYQVVVHTDATALAEGSGTSTLPVETVRRLSCDGSIVHMTDGADGEPLSVGRRQRTVTTAIRRALWARDKGCAYPGCTHRRYVDAHHIVHWSHGGQTSVDNLILLCSAHHRRVHEGGYEIRKDHAGNRYFRRPDGRAVPACGYRLDDVEDCDVGDPDDFSFDATASGSGNLDGVGQDDVNRDDAGPHDASSDELSHDGSSRRSVNPGAARHMARHPSAEGRRPNVYSTRRATGFNAAPDDKARPSTPGS